MKHDLDPGELEFLAGKAKRGESRWRWVRTDAGVIRDVCVRIADGLIVEATAEGDHDTTEIVRAVHDACLRRHERRSSSAKKAAITRARRVEKRVYEAAQNIINDRLRPSRNCTICGRGLDDHESIRRGIGSECWSRVLEALEATA